MRVNIPASITIVSIIVNVFGWTESEETLTATGCQRFGEKPEAIITIFGRARANSRTQQQTSNYTTAPHTKLLYVFKRTHEHIKKNTAKHTWSCTYVRIV